jgi:hypothetical protein
MTDITHIAMPQFISPVRRKRARRFWGTISAAMLQTSRWLETRSQAQADAALRRAHPYRTERPNVRGWHCD